MGKFRRPRASRARFDRRDHDMRIVVKVGTSTLAHPTGRLNIQRMEKLCKVLSDLKNMGHEIILVSSGAIAMGFGKLNLSERPKDVPTKQASAAVGQCELMYIYDKLFTEYNHTVAQLLITAPDIEEGGVRKQNFHNTLARLWTEQIGHDARRVHKTGDGKFLWTYASVKNILTEEAYTGVLINHRREYRNGKAQPISTGDWLRHENFYPEIIEKTTWLLVQERLKQQARPAAGNRAKHRYAGLLSCRDCGDGFIPMIRYWNGSQRIEYVCRGYHRNGKGHCSSHRIHEEVLDQAVWNYAEELRKRYAAELKKVTQLQKQWALRRPSLDAHCLALQKEILKLEQEIDELVMEKLKNSECLTCQPDSI